MSIERTYYCDAPDCETHQRTAAGRPPSGWIVVSGDGRRYFCGWDCVLKFAATIPPVKVIEA